MSKPPDHRRGGRQIIPRPQEWSAVDGPLPFSTTSSITTALVVDALRDTDVTHVTADFTGVRPSAVLVLVADDERGQAGVLLTRRSTALRNHSGEMSFPGGRLDPGESDVAAALREANEEVGLDPAAVEIIGELDHLATTVSRSHIVPVVGRASSQLALRPHSPEVERVMWVSLAEFVRPDTYRAERWIVPEGLVGADESRERTLYFFELDDETVWGATARILVDLLRRLGEPDTSNVTRPMKER